ncbi:MULTISPECIES: hypothetical protein [Clostridium]|uniref:Uncharacterized protein n=1 Tax=Clostridium ljungdahlii (strain ATCC 55383 / DSM 13528 / PETC) TaxID=748727 RepID=A0ABX2TPL2_CLOLD|nr:MULTISPECIES: hypothetical protein [Clostridium]ALU36531.1 Hypothetical protein CLAU_2102 [Clostridium autoethanogenum DSM 10061]OAA84383.1 hypothetical protein WX45_01046 [Clostridium ljungdahlii DSM 13528]OVY48617.1 hypothetical protein WX72_00438 [Clostridium autoethanogenum]
MEYDAKKEAKKCEDMLIEAINKRGDSLKNISEELKVIAEKRA